MMEKLRALDLHYADVEARLSAPETYEDPALVARLNKEQRELEPSWPTGPTSAAGRIWRMPRP